METLGMISGSASANKGEPLYLELAGGEIRAQAYGGLVGQMIADLDARMTNAGQPVEQPASPEDLLHGVSVVCGYAGLIAGFAVVAAPLLTRLL